ncbi:MULTISPECIES: ABC transporter ATP-binding protein [Micrococcaceae]|uniref:ABC transporter ATP-binding protein n=1 Tax=Micrococcaceae TaxID=1268 RepID=UPI000BB774B3|nr:ABC transporter ATP-binding protein [Glutamicibacter sp. BW78]PCC25202.1 multidrug ABC transporter ATP-binding protein [Glutamicibacter sp. BW78]
MGIQETQYDGGAPVRTPAAGSGVVATGLARSFGTVRAVEAMDFTARPGEVTALIGPNGSGKTTLLLMLASLLAPDTGSIRICGIDPVEDPRGARALLGWMPDTLGVWEELTVHEILAMMGRLYGASKVDASARSQELLELVKLDEFASQPARVLSRGQQQKLSLARALVNDPQVLLLDEPASGLDPGARIELRNLLRELAGRGRTVVVSSHVLAELDEMADRAVFVSAGRTVSEQRVDDAGSTGRRYAIEALDREQLTGALDAAGIEFTLPAGTRQAEAVVHLGSDPEAAALLRQLIVAGVGVVAFGPASGILEESYLRAVNTTQDPPTHPTAAGEPQP